jgi:exopolyphosphatase/guanosine-5'-triphosphate,3'-diphosphate pyrophosphatase
MRLATIDIGTNTAQLLVTGIEDGDLSRLHVDEHFVRLGEGVDASGYIVEAAQDRLLDTLRSHRDTAQDHGVHQIVAAGTSALRDASNRDEVLGRIQNELQLPVDVLSGEAEAAWSFAAACDALDDLSGPTLVVDIGGGSTEVIAGTNPSLHGPRYVHAITERASLDVGCVRLTERCFSAQPPRDEEVAAVDGVIDTALQDASLSAGPDLTVVGTAGTATALARVHAGPDFCWEPLHGEAVTLSRANVQHWRARLLSLSVDEIRALHPAAMKGRADVFTVGVLLLARILDHFGAEALRVSPYELRHGLALQWYTRNSALAKSS